ncbi:MAG TPA: hypothetical protein VG456_13580 [Candidatus Sulfopaludibacter sp.]|jgi:hypothetical protein|nr:hypothetical protein [Candidatus Sulfopaludibacter sp.]
MTDVQVQTAEYMRLLGYPRDFLPTGRAGELAEAARQWYADNGRPWVHTREIEKLELGSGTVVMEGVPFTSKRLHRTLDEAGAHGVVLAAISAGPEAEQYAQQLWREEKPDEYFFLEVYASAVVEQLTTAAGAQLCGWAEDRQMAVLPHYSPGYAEWDIGEQVRLAELLGDGLPGPLRVLDSGALVPKKSLLAVFGLTKHVDRTRRLTDLIPCENCSFTPCKFRRTAYRRELPVVQQAYSVNLKALKRWAAERLSLERQADGSISARFRYDGTTCTNMGRPLAFDYFVKLGRSEEGYPIREERCVPAADDTGHRQMCQYLANPAPLMDAISREKPLLGQPLEDVLSWRRISTGAGCYCDAASREHKWGLALETIHYALNRDRNS